MLLCSEHSHKAFSTDSHTKKTSFTTVSIVLCLPSSSFRPWVPDLNWNNKSLEPMSETLDQCKYFLHSKSSYKKFLNALFVQDTASLEPSEVEVKSISLIISKTRFFHYFLFPPGIYIYPIFTKTILTFFQ